MVRTIACLALAFAVAAGAGVSHADEFGTPIDLSAFGREATETPMEGLSHENLDLEEVAVRLRTSPRRFYLSGMIGPSFAMVTSPATSTLATDDTLFNAGGAIGIAIERTRGQLRLEVEGMGRSTYTADFANPPQPDAATVLTNNWSVMQNVWRDLTLTERFGIYGGGGIGAGGYLLGQRLGGVVDYAPPAANFAWQFGGGLLWDVSDRLTFDVGYRYFQISTISQAGVQSSLFEASELMFTLRLYEPFRIWRR